MPFQLGQNDFKKKLSHKTKIRTGVIVNRLVFQVKDCNPALH